MTKADAADFRCTRQIVGDHTKGDAPDLIGFRASLDVGCWNLDVRDPLRASNFLPLISDVWLLTSPLSLNHRFHQLVLLLVPLP